MAFASAFTTRKRKSMDEEGKEDDDDEGGDDKAPVAKAARIKVTTATAAKPPPKPAQRQPASRREEAATPPPPAIDTVRQSVSDALKELLPQFLRDFTPARVHSPESSPMTTQRRGRVTNVTSDADSGTDIGEVNEEHLGQLVVLEAKKELLQAMDNTSVSTEVISP